MGSPSAEVARPGSAAAHPLASLLTETAAVADAAGRADLTRRLESVRERVLDPRRRILVVGPMKQGKSQFVNSLLNLTVCSVGDDEATAVPTLVQHAAEASAELVLADPGAAPIRVPVPLTAITAITPRSPYAQGKEVRRLEINVPSPLLADGLVLVDTPGVGGHGNPHSSAVLGLVPGADAVLVLHDAGRELTEPEVGFLRQVMGLCANVACLVTKIDLYPHWREVVEANRGHLARNGIRLPLIPVSASLRTHALRLGDQELNAESGFPLLYDFLRDQVVRRANDDVSASVGGEVRSAAEHLALSIGSELAALRDPARAAAAVTGLQQARTAAVDLHKKTSRWQQTLADGIADLVSDIDHDLRERLRRLTRDAEEWIDACDPGQEWERIGDWLTDQIGTAVGDNFVWAHERSVWLAQLVAEHFAEAGAVELPRLVGVDAGGVLEPVDALADLESGRVGITQKMLVGMRGSYGGVLMFGMITTMAGLALINPISIGAGMLLGTKAYREDKDARLTRRRAEAKMAVRRYAEDANFQANKESKDRLRDIQRTLRDHFTDIADQTLRSLDESLRAAQEAANAESADQAERAADLERRLRAVAELRMRADRVSPALGA